MKTFYISIAIFAALVAWLLNKPIPKEAQVAREFTDTEVLYLERSFDYSMDALKEGEHFDWTAAGVNGRISVGPVFKSALKTNCRNYVEISRTYDAQKTESGVACKRQDTDGWCRLRPKEPQSCALESAESAVAKRGRYAIMEGSQMIDEVMGTKVNTNTNGLAPPAPTTPGINRPSIEAPDTSSYHRPALFPWEKSK